jgi:hypothetical protein
MTRTLKIIAALAIVSLSAPAFARGGGHGGMSPGGNGQHSGQPTTPVSWNLATNTGTQHNGQSMNSTTWNKITNTAMPNVGMGAGKHHTLFFSHRHQQRILRLQIDAAKLRELIQQEMGLNNPRAVARLQRELRRVVQELKNESARHNAGTNTGAASPTSKGFDLTKRGAL